MSAGTNLAAVAALIGDPGRANMLAALCGGRPLAASELAEIAGVTPQTASGHLVRLVEGRLVTVETHGRQRLFRLGSVDVARMLEGMMGVSAAMDADRRAPRRIPRYLIEARTCYDHIAGRLGVALADRLVALGAVELTEEAGEVTEAGRAILSQLQIEIAPRPGSRRASCRPCLDWSERRRHIGGALGSALLQKFLEWRWVETGSERRALRVTPLGRQELSQRLGLDFP